jgi:hypothetical protein
VPDFPISGSSNGDREFASAALDRSDSPENFAFPRENEPPPLDRSSEATSAEAGWEDKRLPADENLTPVVANQPQSRRLSILPYLSLFCCLVLSYSLLTFIHKATPHAVEPVLKAVPWLGDAIFRNDHLRRGIDLKLARPAFQPIPGSRDVFVLSGVAVNHNPISVRGIQLEGNVYNAEGKEIEKQTIWIGNAISSKIIRGMTAQEISDIQKLPPLKRFEVAPDESIAFAIVFLKPTKDIKSFSCRVVSTDQVT